MNVLPAVRRGMAEFNADVPLFGAVTPAYLREQHIRQERLLGALLGAFGVFALALCCLGIYGLLAYCANRRITEIGVRMALGAQSSDVIRMIIRESLAPVAIGLVAGIAAAPWNII